MQSFSYQSFDKFITVLCSGRIYNRNDIVFVYIAMSDDLAIVRIQFKVAVNE